MSKVIATIRKGEKGKPPTVSFRTEGVPGVDCRTASKPYIESIGGQVVSDVPTDEMHQVAAVTESATLNV